MPYVRLEKPRPHVSVITLDRPERMNAMSFDLDEAIRARKEGRKPRFVD